MILIAARHVAPTTCTPRDKKTRFSKWTKDKCKTTELSRIQIQTLPSQWLITIKPRNWPLVSQSPPWWVHWQQRHKVWSSDPRPHEVQLEDQKIKKAQEGHLEEGKPQKPTKGTKSGKIMKRARKAQKQSKSSKSTLSLKSTPPKTLNANSPP
jgi:hypothetical protein